MAATHTVYDNFHFNLFRGRMGDLGADTLRVALLDNGHTLDAANDDAFADVSADEIAAANGYTANGVALAGVTVVLSAGTTTLDANDSVWTASGGSIVARYAVLYNDTPTTPTANPLISIILLDDTPGDVTATDGNTLTLQWNASGVVNVS